MRTPKLFLGKWRIVEAELWEKEDLDLVVPAFLEFAADGLGSFRLVAVQGELDCRFAGRRVEFSWVGDDEGDEASGRGWADVGLDGWLRGRLYFHGGDDSEFAARRK